MGFCVTQSLEYEVVCVNQSLCGYLLINVG
jgi:hypothetical protein